MSIFSKNATYLKNICSTRTFRNTHGSNKSGKLHRRKNCGEEKKNKQRDSRIILSPLYDFHPKARRERHCHALIIMYAEIGAAKCAITRATASNGCKSTLNYRCSHPYFACLGLMSRLLCEVSERVKPDLRAFVSTKRFLTRGYRPLLILNTKVWTPRWQYLRQILRQNTRQNTIAFGATNHFEA